MRVFARTLVALCIALGLGAARQDPEGLARNAFDALLPAFEHGEASRSPLSGERLEELYGLLLALRAERPDLWPDDVDFLGTLDAVHARAHADGHDLAPYAATDWSLSLWFESDERYGEIQSLFERNLLRYPPTEPHRPLFLYSLGHYERLCGRWEAALDLLDDAEASVEELTDDALGAEDLVNLARVMIELERGAVGIELGLFEEAIPAVERARELTLELEDPGMWGDVVVEELNLALALDDFERLAATYERARANPWYAEQREAQRDRWELRRGLGRAELERARPEAAWEARAILEEVLVADRLIDFEAHLARLWLADLLIERGAIDEAEVHLGRMADSRTGTGWCGDDLPDRLEIDRVVLEARIALARASGGRGETLEANLERMEAAFESLLTRWRATEIRDQGLAVQHTRHRLQVTEWLVALTAAVHGERGPALALDQVVRAQAQGSLARALGARAASEGEVRRELTPARGGLLLFLPGATRTFAFASTATETRLFELPPIYRLDSRRRALSRTIGQAVQPNADASTRARVDELARELANDLLPEELRLHLDDWEELVIVGVDSLGYVPFELLPWKSGQRLGDAKAVSYLPSIPVGLWLARRPSPPDAREVTVVAAPDATGRGVRTQHLTALPFGAAEERLLLLECELPTRVVSGEAATLQELGAFDPTGHVALHLVAHGVRTDSAHRPPGLLFADGTLTPDAAQKLAVPPVVAVTACGAWKGAWRRGDDGRDHLAGSLLLAGARTLILSHAPIDYRSSLRTMGGFYRGLTREGRSPASALMMARRASDDDLTPYLVHAVGLASEPILEAPRRRTSVLVWAVVILVACAVVLLAFRRRKPL